MKCQMQGCRRTATKTAEFQGIINGIYVEQQIHHCGRHWGTEIAAKLEQVKREAVAAAGVVNPYLVAPKITKQAI